MRVVVVALLAARAAWAAEPSPPDAAAPEDAAPPPAGAAAVVSPPAAPPAPPPAATPSPSPSSSPARVGDDGVFALRSGGTIAGRLVSTGPEGDVVELRSGQRVRLPAGAVVGRVADLPLLIGEPWDPDPEDPARIRHVHVPTALALRRGEVAVTASGAALPEVEVGVTRWLTASAAFSMPVLYGTPLPQPGFAARVAAHVDPLRWLHASAGVEGLSGQGGFAAVLFATVTAGTPASHVTLYAGPPLAEAGRLGAFDEVVLAAGGTLRLFTHVSIVGEAWVTPRAERREALASVAARLFNRRFSVDAGWLQATSGEGAPWLALGWRGSWTRE